MKRIHLLSVQAPPSTFAPLLEAGRREGVRIGWLELAPPQEVPPELEEAAALGALRAVRVGGGHSLAVKALRGEPTLREVLREHFLGCLLVLVRSRAGIPRLEAADDGWRIEAGGESVQRSTEELITSLARPRPWPGS